MYIYQYICLAVFGCLLFNKTLRFPAIVFLLGWCFYFIYLGIKPPKDPYYYLVAATIETTIAYLLNNKFRLVSYLGYSLILVNIFGYCLFINEMKPTLYDIIYSIITVSQVLLLISRGLLDGINGSYKYGWAIRFVNFDSFQSRVTMHKNKAKKEANK